MRLMLLQLSDIHVKDSDNSVLRRAAEIRRAARAISTSVDGYFLLYSGDLAFSGKQREYELASKFCDEIKSFFENGSTPVFEAFVPGNHDLDFSTGNDARPVLLDSLTAGLTDINLRGDTVAQILAPQKYYFEFIRQRTGQDLTQSQKLYHETTFQIAGKSISVHCINTAWMSNLQEVAGRLLVPSGLLPKSESCGDIVISMLHHPHGWLEPNNARELRSALELISDVVLTGHEHVASSFRKEYSADQQLHYLEGDVLFDENQHRSGFNVILLDLENKSYDINQCLWDGTMYVPTSLGSGPFIRNLARTKSSFRNTEQFLAKLRDPGTPFHHPIHKNLVLRDLFVYPDLRHRTGVLNPTGSPSPIEGRDALLAFLGGYSKVAIVGEESSGKSSLAKVIYEDLQNKGLVPVLLKGPDFDGFTEKDVRRTIKIGFEEQYGDKSYQRFLQNEPAQKAIIIDDWQKVKYNPKGQTFLINKLTADFGKVIFLGTDILQMERITERGAISPFAQFEYLDIREFGLRLRGKLIERWHILGQEYTIDETDFVHSVKASEHKINDLMGKNLLPSYPIIILTMLQFDEPITSNNSTIGSYGHLYEVLITRRLAEVSKKASDLGTKYTYISRIAYSLFKKGKNSLSVGELQTLHEEYCREYKIRLSIDTSLQELRTAQILANDGNCYRFRYRACYCYFVAKYFQENMANDEATLRDEVNYVADRIYFEDYANIIIFYVFLTKDNQLIQYILQNARRIYAGTALCDIARDTSFANRLLKGTNREIALVDADAAHHREEHRRCIDQEEAEANVLTEADKIVYRDDLNDLIKVNIAFKTLRIMGQILRNFPGVLKGKPKFELTEESYQLGLRALGRIVSLLRDNTEDFHTYFAQMIRERKALKDNENLDWAADQALIWLTRAVCYAVIKKVSFSVGLQELELTYEEVRQVLPANSSVDLIDLAIKLDHFRETPEADILELKERFAENQLTFTILRDLVADYLYLYVSDARKLQKIGAVLDISTKSPQYRLNKKALVS